MYVWEFEKCGGKRTLSGFHSSKSCSKEQVLFRSLSTASWLWEELYVRAGSPCSTVALVRKQPPVTCISYMCLLIEWQLRRMVVVQRHGQAKRGLIKPTSYTTGSNQRAFLRLLHRSMAFSFVGHSCIQRSVAGLKLAFFINSTILRLFVLIFKICGSAETRPTRRQLTSWNSPQKWF